MVLLQRRGPHVQAELEIAESKRVHPKTRGTEIPPEQRQRVRVHMLVDLFLAHQAEPCHHSEQSIRPSCRRGHGAHPRGSEHSPAFAKKLNQPPWIQMFRDGQHCDDAEEPIFEWQMRIRIQVKRMPCDFGEAAGRRQLVDSELLFEGSMSQEIGVASTSDVEDPTQAKWSWDQPICLFGAQSSE